MNEILKKYLMLSGAILLALTFTVSSGMAQATQTGNMNDIVDDIEPYDGSTGPGSFLYGLKVVFEDMGEAFTFNETEKVKKQVEHAELRIAEAKAEFRNNNTEAMNRALVKYREKIVSTDDRVSGMRSNEPGFLDVQERIIRHQLVLRNLGVSQTGNRDLETALNNSIRLEEKFELRTRVKFEREMGDDRMRVRVREIEIEEKEIETEIEDNAAKVKVKVKFIAGSVDRTAIEKEIIEKIKLGKDDIGRLMNEAEVSGTPTATRTPGATVTGTPIAGVTGTPEATDTPEMERPEGELKVRVESGRSVSEVELEFRFVLNTVNKDEIIKGIEQRLSALKVDDLKRVEIEFRDRREDRRGRDSEAGDDRSGRAGEVGDDRGGRASEAGDDRGGGGSSSRGRGSDDSGGSSSGGSSGGGGSGSGGGGGRD